MSGYSLYAVAGLALIVSILADRARTIQGVKIALRRFLKVAPALVTMVLFVSLVLALIPPRLVSEYLAKSGKWTGLGAACVLGSVTLMPGFVAFPLCGILLKQGVPYMVLSAFTTTLMMVGVLTYPLEKAYFGVRVTVIRNSLSLATAIIVAVATGICFGELG